MMNREIEVWRLGRVAYASAWALQNRLADERGRGGVDRLLLLEHPHTYTLGSSGHDANLLLPEAARRRLGIDVFRTDRGGDITYHGPGQLVGYPIIQLERDVLRADFIGYVRRLEQVIIATIADYSVTGYPIKGLTGVWVNTPGGAAKIAAIGVRINVRAVTKHGFALNLNTDLRFFGGIIPCGIRDKGVTSLAALLGAPVDERAVTDRLLANFGTIFGYAVREAAGAAIAHRQA
ncbi:MAG: lipoyl(octanoyl) transferase LipB [Anaerolineae bacterium]|nr:lipoyl(octanoyl) transferase LipB [Anaerolineae bacterium]